MELKDSGQRESFTSGAVRDTQDDKPRPFLLSPFAAERKAIIMAKGAKKYAARNWEKGMPISRIMESLERHLMAFKQGKTDEDHLAQLAWNADAALHFDELVKRGQADPALSDMPCYYKITPDDLRKTTPVPEVGSTEDAKRQDAWLRNLDNQPTAEALLESFLEDDFLEGVENQYGVSLPLGYDGEDETSPDDERRAHYFAELVTMGCSDDIAGQIVGGMTFTPCDRSPGKLSRWVYIAGPMRGYPDFNFPAFDKVRDEFVKDGFNVISPADIDRTTGDQDSGNQTLFALRDFWSLLFISTYEGSGLHLMPGWEKSVGASAEMFLARWIKLPLVYGRDLLGEVRPYRYAVHSFAMSNAIAPTE